MLLKAGMLVFAQKESHGFIPFFRSVKLSISHLTVQMGKILYILKQNWNNFMRFHRGFQQACFKALTFKQKVINL